MKKQKNAHARVYTFRDTRAKKRLFSSPARLQPRPLLPPLPTLATALPTFWAAPPLQPFFSLLLAYSAPPQKNLLLSGLPPAEGPRRIRPALICGSWGREEGTYLLFEPLPH